MVKELAGMDYQSTRIREGKVLVSYPGLGVHDTRNSLSDSNPGSWPEAPEKVRGVLLCPPFRKADSGRSTPDPLDHKWNHEGQGKHPPGFSSKHAGRSDCHLKPASGHGARH